VYIEKYVGQLLSFVTLPAPLSFWNRQVQKKTRKTFGSGGCTGMRSVARTVTDPRERQMGRIDEE
jgi:hypothetical protein